MEKIQGPYKNVQEMFDEMERERKEHPIRTFFENIYYGLCRFVGIPGEIYRRIKYFIQRGKRGYADADVWSLHFHLSDVIAKSLKKLRDDAHGFPCGFSGSQAVALEETDEGLKKWRNILDKMIWTFETAQKISEHNLIYVSDERTRMRLEKAFGKDDFYQVMSKEECKQYKEGWKLFQKYYFDLWD